LGAVTVLRDIYHEIYGPDVTSANLQELAEVLSGIAKRRQSWTWRYLNNILKGYDGFSISKDMDKALEVLGRRLDGESDLQSLAHEVRVLALNGIEPGSLVMGHTQRCPGCMIKFVPNHHLRIYCPGCRPSKVRYSNL